MKIFLDTANIEEIRATAELGLLDGVTTNPTLLSMESAPYRKVLEQICEIVPGPVSAEVVSEGHQGMVREGKELSTIAENIVVKCPLTPEGLKAVRKLKDDGIRCNVTLCFSVPQAIFAAKAGADPAKVRAALLGGAAASPILENQGARMLARDFAPGFRAELQQKDLNVALSAARELGVVLPATAAAEQIYNGVRARGAEKDDHISVLKVLEDLAGGAGGP